MRSLIVASLISACCGVAAGGPAMGPASDRQHRIKSADALLPSRLADAGWTRESLAALASFDDRGIAGAALGRGISGTALGRGIAHPAESEPPYPLGIGTALGYGQDVCLAEDMHAAGTRGFMLFAPWPDGEIIYDWTDDIIDLFFEPPDDPSPNEINALRAIPNTVLAHLYIESITQGRIKFIGYDPAVHGGDGYVLIESNGPEDGCFNAAGVGYQANTEGQFYSVCSWTSFGTIVHEWGHTMGFFHEHQRRDRETYIQMFLEHVAPASIPNGVGVSQYVINNFSGANVGDYDYGSIMHYPALFRGDGGVVSSINGLPVFTLRNGKALEWLDRNPQVVANLELIFQLNPADPSYEQDLLDALFLSVGNGDGLSDGDIESIFLLYGGPGEPRPWVFDPLSGCPADVNQDSKMTVADLIAFLDLIDQQSPFADLNGDGVADSVDFQIFYALWTPGYCLTPDGPKPPPGRPVVGVVNN